MTNYAYIDWHDSLMLGVQIIFVWYLQDMTFTIAAFPLCRPIPYPAPSMYSLRLNCSVGSSISSATIGILVVAVVAPLVKVAVYRPGVKSAPATNHHCN